MESDLTSNLKDNRDPLYFFRIEDAKQVSDIKELWTNYNNAANALQNTLGRTSNIVGEYAEYLTAKYYGGERLIASYKSADVKVIHNNTEIFYQVKARKLNKLTSSQLGIIRSWDFDFLIVIIFDSDGIILKALEIPVSIAQEYAKENDHQNGWVITTTQDFLNNSSSRDITGLI